MQHGMKLLEFHPSRPPGKKQSPEKRSPKIFPIKKRSVFLFRIRFPSQALRKLQLKSVDDEVGQFFFSLFLVLLLDHFKSKCGVFGDGSKYVSAESVPMMCHIYMYIDY